MTLREALEEAAERIRTEQLCASEAHCLLIKVLKNHEGEITGHGTG